MRIRRAIISIILILSVLASTVVMMRFDSEKADILLKEAQAATYDDNGFVEYVPAADMAADYGTAENPFTVLEIVPYERRKRPLYESIKRMQLPIYKYVSAVFGIL